MSGYGNRESAHGDSDVDATERFIQEALLRSTIAPVDNPVRLRQSVCMVNGTLMFLVLMNGRMSRTQEAAELKSVKTLYPTLFNQPVEFEVCFLTEASPVGAAFCVSPKDKDTMSINDPVVINLKIDTP